MTELEWGSDEWKDKCWMEIEEANWERAGYVWDEYEEEYVMGDNFWGFWISGYIKLKDNSQLRLIDNINCVAKISYISDKSFCGDGVWIGFDTSSKKFVGRRNSEFVLKECENIISQLIKNTSA